MREACEVSHCTRPASRFRLCVPHAMTWLLTPDAAHGPDREARRRAFVSRQELRHALAASAT